MSVPPSWSDWEHNEDVLTTRTYRFYATPRVYTATSTNAFVGHHSRVEYHWGNPVNFFSYNPYARQAMSAHELFVTIYGEIDQSVLLYLQIQLFPDLSVDEIEQLLTFSLQSQEVVYSRVTVTQSSSTTMNNAKLPPSQTNPNAPGGDADKTYVPVTFDAATQRRLDFMKKMREEGRAYDEWQVRTETDDDDQSPDES